VADHREALLARLEALGFLVLAGLGAPPPLLMHVGAVGGVHETHDGVVDVGVEVHAVDQLRPAADHALEHRRRLGGLAGADPDEHQTLAFGRVIAPDPMRATSISWSSTSEGIAAQAPSAP
jgi:hypothetical protein